MMNGIAIVLLRTTLCTTVAAVLASLLLRTKAIRSPVVHRVVWVIVLLQGWAMVPFVWEHPVPVAQVSSIADNSMTEDVLPIVHLAIAPQQNDLLVKQRMTAAAKWVWLGGALVLTIGFAWRYASLTGKIPFGRLASGTWKQEWEHALREAGLRKIPEFRISESLGPLCCYLPFFYLVLVPQRLWLSLDSKQRTSILRHELAHISRSDLWKSLAIRILALPQWFNPLAWKAVRAFDEAAEWACDDHVMESRGEDQISYPSALLEMAEFQHQPLFGSFAARGNEHQSDLGRRVRRIVQTSFMEETKMKKLLIPCVLSGLLIAQSIQVESVAQHPSLEAMDRTPAEQRKADLAAAGMDPYRVGPTDVIVIKSVLPENAAAEGEDAVIPIEYLVRPDGTIWLGGDERMGLYVAGQTLAEIERLVSQKQGIAPGDVSVEMRKYNSKAVYVFSQKRGSDQVHRIPCTAETRSTSVLKYVRDEVDVDTSEIVLSRQVLGEPEVLTLRKNGPLRDMLLLPGDRLLIKPVAGDEQLDKSELPEGSEVRFAVGMGVKVGAYQKMPTPDSVDRSAEQTSMDESTQAIDGQKLDQLITTRSYAVGDLLDDQDEGLDFSTLIGSITTAVAVDSWEEVGGVGQIAGFPTNKSLIVAQTRAVHEELVKFLARKRQAN